MAASEALKYRLKINDVFGECLTKDPKYMSDSVMDACISFIENYANYMRPFMANQSEAMDTILYQ